MTELEKAEYILKLLNDKNFDIDIKEAFKLTQSYSWFFQLVVKMKQVEEKSKNDK